ncbi:MAG: DUF2332 family protein [Egibacteraceae bacterium]
MDGARAEVAHPLSAQAESCRILGSPLSHHLLSRAAKDVLAGGPVREIFAGARPGVFGDAEALRLMAAVHRLVLQRRGRLGGVPRDAR